MAKGEPKLNIQVTGPASVREIIPAEWVSSPAQIAAKRGEWPARRAAMKQTIERYLGTPSCSERPTGGAFGVISEEKLSDYRQLKIEYDVAAGEKVRAWLLIPPAQKRCKGAAVVCLHGTAAEAKDTVIGRAGKPGRDYARLLAQHGFVTIAPDHECSGERLDPNFKAYDSTPFYRRHPNWSMAGKAIWDAQCALDVVSKIEGVDAARLGVCGHSLGGQGSAFLAAFDERIKAAVCSCGLTVWAGDALRLNWSRKEWYVYFPKLRAAMEGREPLPFEYYDFFSLAAPRAMMNISGLTDTGFGNMQAIPEMGRQVHRVYELLGNPEGFANFVMGGPHDTPRYSRMAMVGWMERWLGDELV